MYSKYLDYTDAAIRANHLASAQNEQKDILINSLKSQVFDLKRIQHDYAKLNSLIFDLSQKYQLLQHQKDRADKQQRIKSDIDKNNILDLRQEIDNFKVNIQKININIQQLIRQNTAKKRMNDARLADIQQLNLQIKNIQNKNQRSDQDNKQIAYTVKSLKEQRKRLQQQCDNLTSILDANIQKLKGLERLVRNNQSINAKLDKTLRQAENDHQKLVIDLKIKEQQAKKTQNKLRNVTNQINEAKITYNNTLNLGQKNKAQAGANAANLNNQISKGKDLLAKINVIESKIRSEQNNLDSIMNEQQKLRRQHFLSLDENKKLNGQLDRLLVLINQYEIINRQLIQEIQIYSDQDQQAISILNRRQKMKQLITTTIRKLKTTQDFIKHIKY